MHYLFDITHDKPVLLAATIDQKVVTRLARYYKESTGFKETEIVNYGDAVTFFDISDQFFLVEVKAGTNMQNFAIAEVKAQDAMDELRPFQMGDVFIKGGVKYMLCQVEPNVMNYINVDEKCGERGNRLTTDFKVKDVRNVTRKELEEVEKGLIHYRGFELVTDKKYKL
jgi:hypothetical protein